MPPSPKSNPTLRSNRRRIVRSLGARMLVARYAMWFCISRRAKVWSGIFCGAAAIAVLSPMVLFWFRPQDYRVLLAYPFSAAAVCMTVAILIPLAFARANPQYVRMEARRTRAWRRINTPPETYAQRQFRMRVFLRLELPITLIAAAGITTMMITTGGAAWPLMLPCVVLVMLLSPRIDRYAQRYAPGPLADLCPKCGYDMRASPDRCPECGTIRESPRGNRLMKQRPEELNLRGKKLKE